MEIGTWVKIQFANLLMRAEIVGLHGDGKCRLRSLTGSEFDSELSRCVEWPLEKDLV